MPRATNSVARKKKHKKILKQAKGYYGAGSKLYRTAKQAVEKGLLYNYRDRRKRRIEFRALWIARINAAAREIGMPYSKLINNLENKDINLNRKILSEIAISDSATFEKIVKIASN